jgi:PTH1 family peptidyl-tRNA hydrolase
VRIIFGIGNPGSRYKNNRHNVGYQFLDYFAEKQSLNFKASKFDYYFAGGELKEKPFLLIKPSSYVNNSGLPVLTAIQEYNINLSDILVVVDDINITTSSIRIRRSGGDGGHNGLYSIIYHLNSDNFPRLRFGIGKEFKSGELPDYVLSDFNENDLIEMEKVFELSALLVEDFITDGFKKMLNSYSRRIKSEDDERESD